MQCRGQCGVNDRFKGQAEHLSNSETKSRTPHYVARLDGLLCGRNDLRLSKAGTSSSKHSCLEYRCILQEERGVVRRVQRMKKRRCLSK